MALGRICGGGAAGLAPSSTRRCRVSELGLWAGVRPCEKPWTPPAHLPHRSRSEEHTSELQSPCNLVCRLLLEKKNNNCSRPYLNTLETSNLLKFLFNFLPQSSSHSSQQYVHWRSVTHDLFLLQSVASGLSLFQ